MAEKIKDKFQAEVEFIASAGGVFEIVQNDCLIFSKKELGRFPEDGEVIEIMESKMAY